MAAQMRSDPRFVEVGVRIWCYISLSTWLSVNVTGSCRFQCKPSAMHISHRIDNILI